MTGGLPSPRPARQTSTAGRGLPSVVWALIAALGLWTAPPARAQSAITITSAPAPSVVFGQVLVFEAQAVSAAADIVDVSLHLQADGQPAFTWPTVSFQPGPDVMARAAVDPSAAALPPFGPVQYWWQLATADGAQLVGEPATFFYEDDRFSWQTLRNGSLTVHWYLGDAAFGQMALETAVDAYSTANRDIRAPLPERLDVYLYADERDARAALQRVGVAWADGHADAALGVVVVVTAPDLSAQFNLRREIPHELTHILVYRATGDNYRRVPVWFNEGLAVMNQVQAEPDLPGVLAAARDSEQFLSLDSLCGAFPADPGEVRLAYAESESFTRYVRGRFGSERTHALLNAYAQGAGCGAGVEQALGQPLPDLEREWLAEEVNPRASAARWRILAPWLLLGALVVLGPLAFFLLTLRPRRHVPMV